MARRTQKSSAVKPQKKQTAKGHAGKLKTSARTPALRVLNALSWIIQEKATDVGVRELATALHVSPSTAHRLLAELAQAEFVNQNPQNERYGISLEFLRLAHLAIASVSLQQIALAHMRRLTEACNETSLLGVYDSGRQEMMFTAMVESSHPLRYSIDLNKWLPVYVGASGLAIMSFLNEAEISSIIKRTRPMPLTASSITNRFKLETEMQKIRQRGYAITHGQRTPGAVGMGAPVFDSSGTVIGDICVTMPESRFDTDNAKRIAEKLCGCAEEVTKAIGGQVRTHRAA